MKVESSQTLDNLYLNIENIENGSKYTKDKFK